MTGTDFMERRACTAEQLHLFFPEPAEQHLAKKAKAICRTCPVLKECAAYATARPELKGVWGGLSDKQRKAVRSKNGAKRGGGGVRKPIMHGTAAGYKTHYYRGEKPCEECRKAHAAIHNERHRIRRAKKAA